MLDIVRDLQRVVDAEKIPAVHLIYYRPGVKPAAVIMTIEDDRTPELTQFKIVNAIYSIFKLLGI